MTTIDDLTTNPFARDSDEDLLEQLRQIRQSRRTPKAKPKKKKANSKPTHRPKIKAEVPTAQLIKNLSAEQRAQILKELGVV